MRDSAGNLCSDRAVFLDRDGVINSLIYHYDVGIVDSPFTSRQFKILPRVPQAIRRLNRLHFRVIIASNQPGIAKGHFSAKTLKAFDLKLEAALKRAGAHLDATYYCLHHPKAVVRRFRKPCKCRKPGIEMFLRAAREFGVDLSRSYMIGDGITDVEAGARAGCRTIFVGKWKCELCQFTNPPCLHPTFVAADLWEAVKTVELDSRRRSSPSRLSMPPLHVRRQHARPAPSA